LLMERIIVSSSLKERSKTKLRNGIRTPPDMVLAVDTQSLRLKSGYRRDEKEL
jgi:hypothetical protein